MNKRNEYFFIIINILIIFVVFKNILLIPLSNNVFTYIVNPVFWILLVVYSYFVLRETYGRYKHKTDKVKLTIIVLLSYLILYLASGLLLGYQSTPYSHAFINILKNIWALILVVILKEYIRFILVKNSKKSNINYVIIVLLFTCLEMSFTTFFLNITTISSLMQYFFGILLPLIVQNMLLTYLMSVSGLVPAITYKVFLESMFILLPIFPKTNWFINGMLGILLPFVMFIVIYSFIEKKNTLYSLDRKYKRTRRITIYLLAVILILFFYGTFKYRPVGVMSNSMYPTFQRGDAVIIENINSDNILSIEKGTVIMYNLDSTAVIHRVVEIVYEDDVKLYRTKGDYNTLPDSKLVKEEQILGIEKFSIPYIGYPSVILQTIINKQEVGVET